MPNELQSLREPAADAAKNDSLQALAAATQNESPTPSVSISNSLAQDPELLSDFILESHEHLATIESQTMVLEQSPEDSDAIHSIFRAFHTIKGLAGFLELSSIQEVSHEVETLLDMARNGKLRITPDAVDIVLASADYLRESIKSVEASLQGGAAQTPPPEHAILARIRRWMDGPAKEPEDSSIQPEHAQPAAEAQGGAVGGGSSRSPGGESRYREAGLPGGHGW